MSNSFYAVKQDMPRGSYLNPTIFQDKAEAIKFAILLNRKRYPSDEYKIHLYEVKELEF